MRTITVILATFIVLPAFMQAQVVLYDDTYNGGVVTGGFSTGISTSGSGNFTVNIPVGSTIRQAYIIGGRCGNVASQNVTLNGFPYTFNAANMASPCFTTGYGGAGCGSGVHAIDITADILPATTLYTLTVGAQNSVSNKYPEFYVVIAFDNGGMSQMSTVVYLQDQDAALTMNWVCNTTTPILTANDVGFAPFGGYGNVTATDCEELNINGTLVGSYQGTDFNANTVYGAMGALQYYNGTLVGLGDDVADQAVSGPEALSEMSALIPNLTTSFPVSFTHCAGGSPTDNHLWAGILAYGTNVILPIELKSFGVKAINNTIAGLHWATASENNSDFFSIERSIDQENFIEIGQVQASGYTSTENEYTFEDLTPHPGMNYYRLRQVDGDGSYEYSNVKAITITKQADFLVSELYPNPTNDHFSFAVTLGATDSYSMRIYNYTGQLVYEELFAMDATSTTEQHINTSELSKGLYFVKFTSEGEEFTRKLLIER